MRKIILLLLMHISIINYAQVSCITALPQEASGFLVLNRNSYPEVVKWAILIYERKIEGTTVSYSKVLSTDLVGVNYYKIPELYWRNSGKPYFVVVTGYSDDHTLVVESDYQTISNDLAFTEECSWTCISEYYAYTISCMVNQNGGSHVLELNSAYSSINSNGIAIPYYRYLSTSEWSQFCGSSLPENAWYNCIEPLDGINQKYLYNVTTNDNIKDSDGAYLTGTVIGVRKSRGPWQNTPMQTTSLIGGESTCQLDLEGAIDELNGYNVINVGNVPELECLGSAEPENEGGESESDIELILCAEELLNFLADESPNSNVYQLAQTLVDCYISEIEGEETVGGIWPGYLDNISIYSLDKTNIIQTIRSNELFNSNGEFIGPSISTEPGLYCFGLLFKDKSYLPLVKELKSEVVSSVPLADFVDVNVFPNPFITNQYDVTLSANAKVKFQYFVIDLNGNVLYDKNFVIQQGHSTTHTVKFTTNLFPGTYINRLVFEDNSIKTINILKQ